MTTSTVLPYVCLLVWNVLSLSPPKMKAAAHAVLFPTLDVLQKALVAASFSFAPGLYEALKSATPPTVAFFKTLPTEVRRNGRDRWGVYVLILEKKGCRPKLYIGCGTNTQGGLFKRFNDYKKPKTAEGIPKGVRDAVNDGFIIVFKGLLCWCPQPIESHAYVCRGLCLLLEALFTFVFWAFVSRTADYGFPEFCPWPKSAFEYDGLCGHSSIGETIRTRNIPLPAGVEKWTPPKKWSCSHCGSKFESEADLKIHNGTQKHINKVAGINNAVDSTRYARSWADSNLASKRYYCKICDRPFQTSSKLTIHNGTIKHKENAAEAAEVAAASKSSS